MSLQLADFPDDTSEPRETIATAWQIEWEKYWRHGWHRVECKWYREPQPALESTRTILDLERFINDGLTVSKHAPKSRTGYR